MDVIVTNIIAMFSTAAFPVDPCDGSSDAIDLCLEFENNHFDLF